MLYIRLPIVCNLQSVPYGMSAFTAQYVVHGEVDVASLTGCHADAMQQKGSMLLRGNDTIRPVLQSARVSALLQCLRAMMARTRRIKFSIIHTCS